MIGIKKVPLTNCCRREIYLHTHERVKTHQESQTGLHQRLHCRDGIINDFLSQYRHLFSPFLFDDVTSLHLPSFKTNDFTTYTHTLCQNMNATRSLGNLTYVPKNAPTHFTERVPTKTVCLIYIKLFGFQLAL